MTRLLHQSLEDLRRHRLLLAAWLVILAMQVVVVAYPFDARFSGLGNSLLGTACIALVVAHFALVVALAVLIVQGDSPVTTTAFWLTRPTGRGMMAAGKAATAVVLLVAAPALADAAAAAANRLPWPDVALVALFSAADHVAVVFSAMAVAAITADLSGFAVTVVGLLIASFAVTALARLSAFSQRQFAPSPSRPAWLETIGPFALVGIVVFAVQYLRPARRLALAALVVVVVLTPVLLRVWNVDWSSREPALDTQMLNPGEVTVTMAGSRPSVSSPRGPVPGGERDAHSDRDSVLVDACLAVTSAQTKILVTPVSLDARLDIAGNRAVQYGGEVGYRRRPYSLPSAEGWGRARQQIAAALAPSRLARDWGRLPSGEDRVALVSLTEAQRARAARDGAVYRADVLLRATSFEALDGVPLRRGAFGRAADRGFTVLHARCDQESCRVVVREITAAFQPDPRPLSNVTYVLRNRRLGVTLMASPWGESRLESMAYVPTPQRLAITHRDLQFGEDAGATVKTAGSWLTDSELVPLVTRDLGVFTRPLVIPDFGAMLADADAARARTAEGGAR